MIKSNQLRAVCAICAILFASTGTLDAKNRKAEKIYKAGEKAEQAKIYDQAVTDYEQALALDPTEPVYTLASRRARFEAGQAHVEEGRRLRKQGQLEAAIDQFQKAIVSDPSSAIGLQEWKRTSEMLEAEKKSGVKGTGPDRGLTPAEKAEKSEDQLLDSMLPPPELEPITRKVDGLKMNNQPPKVLYDTVGKLAGINVVFDPTYTPPGDKRFSVDLTNQSLEQAFDNIAVLTHTWWKPISTNTIFVTEDNPTKRRDFEDNVVKVFYVKNTTSVQEFQEISTAVRTITEIRRVFTYNAQKAIVVRGTADAVALAEKIIHDLDKPKAEVVVDVVVMEVNSDRTSDIAATLTSGGVNGLSLPIGFSPRNSITINGSTSGTGTGTSLGTGLGTSAGTGTGTGTTTAIGINNLGRISSADFYTTLPGALFSLVMKDTSTKILQSPQVRASDGQKVTLKIGDKIPYASGSFQPGIGTVGVSPLVSTQFQFADVGVNVDMTPQVHGTDEVTLKMVVEISSVSQYVTIGGISQPVIGQRRNETEVRLRDGEVNILGGLSQMQNSKTLSGIPGLVDIPVLGGLLGGEQNRDKSRQQILIAVIPHIVRTPNLSPEDMRGVFAGTEQTIRMSYAPKEVVTQSAPAPPVAPPPQPAPAPVQPAGTQPAQGPIPGVPNPSGPPLITFMPSSVQTQLSAGVTVTLQFANATDVFAATPLQIKFDPRILRLMDVSAGDLLTRDGQRVNVAKDIRNDAGEASITLTRLPGTSGASGTGALATFTFVAIGKGSTDVTVSDMSLKNSQQQPIVVTPPVLRVNVQ